MPWEISPERHEKALGRASCPHTMWCLFSGGSILLAVALGYWANTRPVDFNPIPAHPVQLLAFAAILLGSVFVFQKPELGLLLLVAFVYSNASEIAVRYHGIPSLLQALGIL